MKIYCTYTISDIHSQKLLFKNRQSVKNPFYLNISPHFQIAYFTLTVHWVLQEKILAAVLWKREKINSTSKSPFLLNDSALFDSFWRGTVYSACLSAYMHKRISNEEYSLHSVPLQSLKNKPCYSLFLHVKDIF